MVLLELPVFTFLRSCFSSGSGFSPVLLVLVLLLTVTRACFSSGWLIPHKAPVMEGKPTQPEISFHQCRWPAEGKSCIRRCIKQRGTQRHSDTTMAPVHRCEYSGMRSDPPALHATCPLCFCLSARLSCRAAPALPVSCVAARSGVPVDGAGLRPVRFTCGEAPEEHQGNAGRGRTQRCIWWPLSRV